MESFLKAVAEDIIKKYGTDLSRLTIVFPNKRASLFLNQYLYEEVGHAVWSPRYITISELFRQHSELKVVDRIEAIALLYECYCKVVSDRESIDRFWAWGEMILADFDDLDKNLGDAEKIFCNVKDLHALDSIDYLTEEQHEALKNFFLQFKDDQDSRLKQRFIQLWNNLYPLYRLYNDTLRQQGLAYEGALYRHVAETLGSQLSALTSQPYLFVGFNMVQKSERMLFRTLQTKNLAHCYWDFDNYYIAGKMQEAGRFIREYLSEFPDELPLDSPLYNQFSEPKDLQILSAPTEDIQARYISQWLSENGRMEAGARTAIVLADEKLLTRVIHCLPEKLNGSTSSPTGTGVNITLGFPLSQSPVTALVKSFIALHIHGCNKSSHSYLLQFVAPLLRHSFISKATPQAEEILNTLHNEHISYPLIEDICKDDLTKLLFKPMEKDSNIEITERLLSILSALSSQLSALTPLEQEAIFRMYTLLNRLKDTVQKVQSVQRVQEVTFARLLDQIIQSTTMPFHGEPAVGIQIMGVLETRNLDFDHVLLLSCNEGNLPKGINDSSLIPYSVRAAHGLTTIDNKVAVYAYYFYRLLQRCPDISVAWNCSTDGLHTGQMSRFLLQLMVEANNIHITKHSLTAEGGERKVESGERITKTKEIQQKLMSLEKLSPSAINKYLRCQKQFYYLIIEGLEQEDSDDIGDKRIFGIVFHKAAELLYRNLGNKEGLITESSIKAMLEDRKHDTVYRCIDEAFTEEIFFGRQHPYDGLQLINREVIMRFICKLLERDKENAPFYHLGDEVYVSEKMQFDTPLGSRTLQVGGIIDRLDKRLSESGDRLIVIDYKTGSKMPEKITTMDDVFNPDNISHHSDYYLQTFLYSSILSHRQNSPVSPALLFIQKQESVENPVLQLEGDEVSDIRKYDREFRDHLSRIVSEIYDPTVPFSPTTDTTRCQFCPYKGLCNLTHAGGNT